MSNWEKYLREIYLDPSLNDDDMFKIEKVIKYKGRGNKKEALVRWLGWPKQFDSWIPVSNLNNNE